MAGTIDPSLVRSMNRRGYLTLKQASEETRYSDGCIANWIKAGLKHMRIGKHPFVDKIALQRWVATKAKIRPHRLNRRSPAPARPGSNGHAKPIIPKTIQFAPPSGGPGVLTERLVARVVPAVVEGLLAQLGSEVGLLFAEVRNQAKEGCLEALRAVFGPLPGDPDPGQPEIPSEEDAADRAPGEEG